MRIRFNGPYALLAAALLGAEVFIARFMHDGFVRPYVGDTLATILLYCLLKSSWRAPAWVVASVALLVSYVMEGAQALHLLAWLGWEHSRMARLLLGSHFEWVDMLAYTLGATMVLGAEQLRRRHAPGALR